MAYTTGMTEMLEGAEKHARATMILAWRNILEELQSQWAEADYRDRVDNGIVELGREILAAERQLAALGAASA